MENKDLIDSYTEKVWHLIQVGNITDLHDMSELAFELTVFKNKLGRQMKVSQHKYEVIRAKAFLHYKSKERQDGKPVSEKQADVLAKQEALKLLDPEIESDYREVSSLLDRLLELKVETAVLNKQERETASQLR